MPATRVDDRPLTFIRNPSHVDAVATYAESGDGDFEAYFPKSASGELEGRETPYHGRDVVWIGDEGKMLRVDPEYMQHIFGNIFDADKLAAVVEGIVEAEDDVWFFAPYGQAVRIDLQRVKESIEYAREEGLDRPYTTGDEELDEYLVDPEEALSPWGDPGEEEYEERKAEMEQELSDAVEEGSGDLGQWAFTIRDGNHRAFGAAIAGEPYIWMKLMDNDYQQLLHDLKAGTASAEQLELADMLE